MIVDWRKYFNSSSTNINLYLSKYGFNFLEQTSQKIKRAINQDKPYIILIKFRNSEIISILKNSEYESALKMILKLCIKFEYYEICSELHNTLKQLQTKKFTKNGRKHFEITTEGQGKI